jgi:hypothetical protein
MESTPSYLTLLLHGKVNLGLRMAYKIEVLTKGEVKIYDWIHEEWKDFEKNFRSENEENDKKTC